MPIRIDNVGKVIRALGKMAANDGRTMAVILYKAAEIILNKSQKYVPEATGALKKSGRISDNGKSGFGYRANVEYGGPEAPYALVVHERIEVPHAPPTCAKYLERAVRESRGTITAMAKRQVIVENK